jgi:hypothetical protein
MSTAQRIKGQEVSILITNAGELEDTLTDIQNFNMEMELETKSMGYLGEKTNRQDSIFNGVKFDFEIHVHTEDVWSFLQSIHDKAQRITPDVVFNITGVFTYPNGDQPEILLNDVSFGAVPVNIGSRGDYVKFKMQGTCEDIEIQLS